MKKYLLTLLTLGCIFSAIPARAAESGDWIEKIAFYLPNRILDATDLFSITLGFGPVAEARLMGTRLADVGAGFEMKTLKFYKDYNRRYGFGYEEGWYWSTAMAGEEEYSLLEASGLLDSYVENRAGVPDPSRRLYDFYEGKRDYWAIGGALGFLVDGAVYIHPVEWLDFGLGFLFIDIKHDDLTLDDFR